MRNRIVVLAALLFAVAGILASLPGNALAHKVSIFAYAERGTLFTESFFPDGTPVENGKVEIFDSQGKKVAEGTTDKAGKASFPIPVKDDLSIVINASMGHKDSFTLKKDELGDVP